MIIKSLIAAVLLWFSAGSSHAQFAELDKKLADLDRLREEKKITEKEYRDARQKAIMVFSMTPDVKPSPQPTWVQPRERPAPKTTPEKAAMEFISLDSVAIPRTPNWTRLYANNRHSSRKIAFTVRFGDGTTGVYSLEPGQRKDIMINSGGTVVGARFE
jgi:hypothetical protein